MGFIGHWWNCVAANWMDGWMLYSRSLIFVFFLSSVIWNEWKVVVVEVRVEGEADEEQKELEVIDIVVEPQVDGERAMEEGIGEAGDGWKVGH